MLKKLICIHTRLTGQTCYTHSTHVMENRKQSDKGDDTCQWTHLFSHFPPDTHTHTHMVIHAPSQYHNPTDPDTCNIPFTLKLNGKPEFHLLASMCICTQDHRVENKLHRLDLSTVSWMWNGFACNIAGLKTRIKKKKKIPKCYHPEITPRPPQKNTIQ